ncbi:MAG: mucoidy inhibitor MuiA family protein [Hyphomicrobiales bacterium]|nr:mucoidy inhibitor MuiA family protein [Hyphomicrobiales bacterium]
MKHLAVAALSLALGTISAEAAEVTASSTISAVTVFPRGAQVTRVVEFSAPAGESTLVLVDFPPTLDVESLRVRGSASAGLEIGAINTRIIHPSLADPEMVSGIAAQIRTLRDERIALDDAIAAATSEKRFIENFITIKPQPLTDDLETGRAGPEVWANAWETVGRGLVRVNEAIRDAEIRQRVIDDEIEVLERKLRQDPSQDKPRLELRVDVAAAAALTGRLSVEYRVDAAGWVPFYDVRLDVGTADAAPKLDLVRRARVAQSSGEDWTDVELKLSTARARGGTAAPDLDPLEVAFITARGRAESGLMKQAMRPQAEMDEERMAGAELADALPAPVAESEARFAAIGFNVVYDIAGKVSIGTGGVTRSVRIGSHETAPKLSVRSVPVRDEAAYLVAEIVNDSGAPLLPGETTLFRDGVFVGKGRIDLVANGDTLKLGFGVDDLVKVTRLPVKRDAGESGILSRQKTDERDLTITVANLHDRPMTVTIVDQLPYSEVEDIEIEKLPDMTTPTRTDIDGKRGVFEWTADYGAKETKKYRLHYRVSWPSDREIIWDR